MVSPLVAKLVEWSFPPSCASVLECTGPSFLTEKEVIPLDSRSIETLQYHMPLSFPKYITKVEATFTNTGGEVSAPLESDIRIVVPSDAIPAGISQDIFFGVFSEETILLRDVPEAPDKTLISPLVECGPHDIHLSKPVEIIVPHCLCLSDAKMEWITVYRCVHFPAQGTWLFYTLMLVLGEKKKYMFKLGSSGYRNRSLCSGTRCEVSLRFLELIAINNILVPMEPTIRTQARKQAKKGAYGHEHGHRHGH